MPTTLVTPLRGDRWEGTDWQGSYLLRGDASDLDLSAWAPLLPASYHIVAINLFCDAFVVDPDGVVYMLEPAASKATRIAMSIAEFQDRLHADREGRLLRNLVDNCRAAGKVPNADQCYAFTTLPLFGGKYSEENIWVSSRAEWLAYTADIFLQTRDLPDGASVKLRVTE